MSRPAESSPAAPRGSESGRCKPWPDEHLRTSEAARIHGRVERLGERWSAEGGRDPLGVRPRRRASSAVAARGRRRGSSLPSAQAASPGRRRHRLPARSTRSSACPPRSLTPARSAADDAVRPGLHPRDLNVRDPRVEREPPDRVHEQELAERRAAAGEPLQVHRRLHVHERQRDELREAAARALLLAHAQQVPRPARRRRRRART